MNANHYHVTVVYRKKILGQCEYASFAGFVNLLIDQSKHLIHYDDLPQRGPCLEVTLELVQTGSRHRERLAKIYVTSKSANINWQDEFIRNVHLSRLN